MAVVIGISVGLDERGRWREGRRYHYLDAAYARALAEVGATPIYLASEGDPALAVDGIGGLLIPGGDDFAPPRAYADDVKLEVVPETQLEFDRGLMDAALRRGLPVLAICYGAQLLVLHRGGALHYHLPSDVPGAGAHRLDEGEGRHGLVIESGTRLAGILRGVEGPVNSLHHQGIADPGPYLRVAARAPDGVIEAVEASGDAFCIGVQWHPEKLAGSHRERLFGALARAAAAREGVGA